MKISKRQLKRLIREEYTHLKNQGLIKESWPSGGYHPGRDFSAPGRVSRYKMQMPNSYIKKDILQILQMDGEQKIERLYRSFQDASSREDFDIAVDDLIKSGSIIYTGHPDDPPDAIRIHPQYKQRRI